MSTRRRASCAFEDGNEVQKQDNLYLRYDLFFDEAVECFKKLRNSSNLTKDLRPTTNLRIQALYKQATIGDYPATKEEDLVEFKSTSWMIKHQVERLIDETWQGFEGMNTIQAKRFYVYEIALLERTFKQKIHEKLRSRVDAQTEPHFSRPSIRLEHKADGNKSTHFMFNNAWVLLFEAGLYYFSLRLAYVRKYPWYIESVLWVCLGVGIVLTIKFQILRCVANSRAQNTAQTSRLPPDDEAILPNEQLNTLGVTLLPATPTAKERPIIELNVDPSTSTLGSCAEYYDNAFEQIIDTHVKKYREPLPDPMAPNIENIVVEVDEYLEEWNCRVIKRVLNVRNNAPGFIRRFFDGDYIQMEEHTLIDLTNKNMYIRGTNRTGSETGELITYSHFSSDPANFEVTTATKECHLKLSGSFGFARGMVERFAKSAYESSIAEDREHFQSRLDELYGE